MVSPLLNTKLFVPLVRPDRTERSRLLSRLDEVTRPGVQAGLISAPAGFGKTSLLSEWITRRGKPCAWLALDTGDNAPGVFLAYLLAALERARPGLVGETAAMQKASLSGTEPVPTATLLATLVNELSCLGPADPLIVALDDFQWITAQEPREIVAFLIDHLPPGVRLVIATRADPPLPLARLRARRQLVELRAADLRFTAEEAAAFLIDGMGIQLNPQDSNELIQAITARTEGWIAGLQMAALALQSAPETDISGFIREFTGSHRYVLDYLAEEVLARLPEETTAFLLQTALLDRFCAGLCEALSIETPLHSGSSELPAARYQALIETLERSNLFLIPLDGQRIWFRYHHLFADLLRARLKQLWPERIPALHRRASAWFESQGLVAEAIQHALAAGGSSQDPADYERAARLVETHTLALFKRGELHALRRWVDLLPEDLAAQRPWFCVYRAWVLVFTGQLEPTEELLRKAETLAGRRDEAERRLLEGHCAAVRAQRGVVTNQLAEVFAARDIAVQKLPEDEWARGAAEWSAAYALRMQGKLETAGDIFERLLQTDREKRDTWGMAMVGTDLVVVRKAQGRLREALRVAETTLAVIEQLGARKLGYIGRLLTAYAFALYERNDLAAAQQIVEEAVEINQRWRNPNHLVYAFLNLARVRAAQGNYPAAHSLLNQAEEQIRRLPVVPSLASSLPGIRVALLLAQGQPPPINAALENDLRAELQAIKSHQPFNEAGELRRGLLARLLIAHGRAGEALQLAAGMEQKQRETGRLSALIETLTLQALAYHTQGRTGEALQALQEAIWLAEPEGAMRSILDAGPLLPGALPVLLKALHHQLPTGQRAYLEQLLAAMAEAEEPVSDSPAPSPAEPRGRAAAPALVEPLSEREMEVLQLLAAGLTNAQIAGRLFISLGTVKAHTANIFRKLDAANRTQAVARAREYALIA